jgi:predicted nuclease of predicted toxin-antitoxin system
VKPRLYLDDCISSKRLQRMLVNVGYEVQTPAQAGLIGYDDLTHFQYALEHSLTIVTKDADDFECLNREHPHHHGVLAICEEADRSKNMSYADIVRAIENLVQAGVPLEGQFHVLNHWR